MNVLVMAPHPDDEVLGVGGTMAKRAKSGDNIFVCVITKGVMPLFEESLIQKTRTEAAKCHEFLGVKKTFYLDFPSVYLEKEDRCNINEAIIKVIKEVQPQELYIPHWGDLQKDHRITAEACMVAARPKYEHKIKRIFAYETLSETGWSAPSMQNAFIPNAFCDISDYADAKIKAVSFYQTQLDEFPAARSLQACRALYEYRGASVGVKAAEAFVLIREFI